MADRHELQMVAAAMHALRPDWRTDSLLTFLEKHHSDRPFRHLAVAACAIAVDPKTTTPLLLNSQGHWWASAATATKTVSLSVLGPQHPRCEKDGHETYLAHNCAACRADALAGETEEIQP